MAVLRFLFGVFLALALGAAALLWDANRLLDEPLNVPAPAVLEVQPGFGVKTVVQRATADGLIVRRRLRLYVEAYARATGRAALIQAGEYELTPGMTSRDLIALIVSGRTKLHEFTIVEGWTFEQALLALRKHNAIRHTLAAEPAATLSARAMAALGHPDLHPEGRFLPETYRFPRGTSDVAFLRRAFDAMAATLVEQWTTRAAGLPYRTPADALVMASIVERETGVPAERGQIAGVFTRRLAMNMRLQTDPTVIYGLGAAFDGNLRRADLLRDTPYNTYTRKGLPPTPICLPGRAAIHAALHPAPGDSLYFVSRGDGSHVFSATLEEHDRAVRRFQLRRR